jgi:hypothetical protein
MVFRYFVVVFCVMNYEPTKRAEAQQIDGDILANELNNVMNDLGLSFIQVIPREPTSGFCTSQIPDLLPTPIQL